MDTERQRVEALSALERIGGRLRHGSLNLPSFDEKQLAACAPESRGRRLVPLPAVDELDDAGYAGAIGQGRSSLLERGFLEDEAGTVVPVGELALVTAARAMPSLVAIVDRVGGADARSSLYLFGLGSAGLLEERPDVDGAEHHFTLRSVEDAAVSLAAFVDPEGRAVRDGPPQDLSGAASADTQARSEVEQRIAAAPVVARVFVTVAAADGGVIDEDFSVATAEDGLWLVGGYEDPNSSERYAAAREVSPLTLQTLLAGCLTVA